MLRFALCVVASIFSASLISTASAAPRQKPVYAQAAPVFTWTGFYVGVHTGWGWATWSATGSSDAHGNGVIGGVQAGYNHQFGNYVVGIEGEFSFSDVKKEDLFLAGQISLKNDYYGMVTGRLGYLYSPQTLVYGKGGVAFTRDKWKVRDGIGGFADGTFDRTGWVIGFGAEHAMWRNVSVKAEYNFLHFGDVNEVLTAGGGITVTGAGDVSEYVHIVKLGLNYRF
jgi:outer membrane immunogenic protein